MMLTPKITAKNLASALLIFTSFFGIVSCAPLKPLNERSKELTWQAWLLVDDQNQNKQYDPDGLMRRRITPKSVFIAPTFSPSDLPACADGYASDSMGRCVKLIQLDENAHLNYLLERLRQQFGNFTNDYDDEDEEEAVEVKPTPGPFQFNIPLEEQEGNNDANVAIVVAPTNGSFNLSMSGGNTVKRDDEVKDDALGVPIIITRINVDDSVKKDDDSTRTVSAGNSTNTVNDGGVKQNGGAEETVLKTTTEVAGTTEVIETTTELVNAMETTGIPEAQAIFFKIPESNSQSSSTKIEEFDSVTSEAKPSGNMFSEMAMQDQPAIPNHQQLPLVNVKHKFRNDPEETKALVSHLLPHANVKTTESIFDEFPAQSAHNYHNRDTSHQSTEKPAHVYNHRNRDKWLFPPAWRDAPPQKPLVLHFHNQQNTRFYSQNRQEGVYRKVPPQDLSYIFGFKDTRR